MNNKAKRASEIISSTYNFNKFYFDDDAIQIAKKRFNDLQDDGVFKQSCAFESDVWYTTNEISNVSIIFEFNQFQYKNYKNIFGVSLDQFVLYLKVYLLSLFGQTSLGGIAVVTREIRKIIAKNPLDLIDMPFSSLKLNDAYHISDFFSIFLGLDQTDQTNIDELEALIDAIETMDVVDPIDNKRTLANFDSYFTFDDILKSYWQKDLSKEERLFYYPICLWWAITAVIPLRVTEFLLTPRECLIKKTHGITEDSHYRLKLRRTKLKGKKTKKLTYTIAGDYKIDSYSIPDTLATEILRYQKWTDQYKPNELNTLFAIEPHQMIIPNYRQDGIAYYKRRDLLTTLRWFYHEIIEKQYGFHVIESTEDKYNLRQNEIEMIHLGDTRHLALINLMEEGGTPQIAMILAGHEGKVSAAHYYSNIKSLIECRTYREYQKLCGNHEFSVTHTTNNIDDHYVTLSDGGRCYSSAYQQHDFTDCMNVISETGKIGECRSCDYYRPSASDWYDGSEKFDERLKDDCKMLAQAVEIVRSQKGEEEEITEALQKVRRSSISYGQFLLDKKLRGK